MNIVMEPGTIRTVHYYRKRGADGKYPVTYWGTLEEQIAEATLANAHAVSSADHKMISLYTTQEDCPHTNPEDDEKYDGVDDLIDAWMARNCPGLKWEPWDDISIHPLIWKNQERAYAVIPLANEWRRAQDVFDDTHNGVCLDDYQGQCCTECSEFDPDYGSEPGACRLSETIREQYGDFWWRASPEGIADRERER